MYRAQEEYGQVRVNSYITTARAEKLLDFFGSVGWHDNNHLYHPKYDNGIGGWFFIFTVGGKGIIKFGGKTHMLLPGTAVAVAPDSPMEYYTDTDAGKWEFYWVSFFGIHARQTAAYIFADKEPVFRLGNLTACLEIVKTLIRLEDDNKFRFELTASQKISDLLNLFAQDLLFRGSEKQPDDFLIKIVSDLEKNFNHPILIEEVAKRFHISQNHLIRRFQAEIGYTPYEYLKKYRLLKACELLEKTNRPVSEIGIMTGFPNASNFICQFKSMYGVTPNQYRNLLLPERGTNLE